MDLKMKRDGKNWPEKMFKSSGDGQEKYFPIMWRRASKIRNGIAFKQNRIE